MSKATYRCSRCRTAIQGDGQYCIQCFRELHKPCPNCMVRGMDNRYRVRLDKALARKEKRRARPVDCGVCNNDRWILSED